MNDTFEVPRSHLRNLVSPIKGDSGSCPYAHVGQDHDVDHGAHSTEFSCGTIVVAMSQFGGHSGKGGGAGGRFCFHRQDIRALVAFDAASVCHAGNSVVGASSTVDELRSRRSCSKPLGWTGTVLLRALHSTSFYPGHPALLAYRGAYAASE